MMSLDQVFGGDSDLVAKIDLGTIEKKNTSRKHENVTKIMGTPNRAKSQLWIDRTPRSRSPRRPLQCMLRTQFIMLVNVHHLPRRLAASPSIHGVISAASFSRSRCPEIAWNDIDIDLRMTPTAWQRPSSSSHSPSFASISSWRAFSSSSSSKLRENYNHILVERRFPEESNNHHGGAVQRGGVGIITLHRPKALNALCDALFDDLIHAVKAFDDDETIGCVVITGSGKAFAAGE